MARYAAAEMTCRRALALSSKTPDTERETGATLNTLANVYIAQARYSEAEELFKKTRSIKHAVLGDDHPELATIDNNLAHLSWRRSDLRNAERLCRRALATLERHLGAAHPDVANVLSNLAEVYRTQRRFSKPRHASGGRSPSSRRPSARTIRGWHHHSTTWLSCCKSSDDMKKRSYSTRRRWRSQFGRTAASIPWWRRC